MQIGEQHQPLAKKHIFLLHRLLDLDDQVGVAPHVVGRAHNLRARVLILVVGQGRKLSSAGLHQHLMPGFAQGFHAGRGNPHAAFVVLHFLRHTNDHASPAVCKELRGRLRILHPGAQETPQLAGQDSRRNRFAQKDRRRSMTVSTGLPLTSTRECPAAGADARDRRGPCIPGILASVMIASIFSI